MNTVGAVVSSAFGAVCLAPAVAGAQNLVVNPGFETHSACPTDYSQLSRATG